MDNMTNLKENLDILIHNFGHAIIAKSFKYEWKDSLIIDGHKSGPSCDPQMPAREKHSTLIAIYLAGSVAESLYHEGYSSQEPKQKSLDRLALDIQYMHPHLVELFKLEDLTCCPALEEVSLETYKEYAINVKRIFEYIASHNNMTPKKFLEKGALNIMLAYSKKNN